MKDPYEVLGVSSSATAEEIKSAYRKMAKQYHPDLHPGDSAAAEKMNEINAAYDILSDPEKLAAYRAGAYDAPKTAQGAYYYGTYDPFSAYGKTGAYGNSGQYGQYGPGPGGQNDHPYGSYENPYGRTQNTYQTGRRIYIRPLGFFGFFGRFVRIMFTFLILRAVLRFILILLLSF